MLSCRGWVEKGGGQKGGGQKGGGPEGWGEGWGPEGWGFEGWGFEGWGPEGWGAKNFALFFPCPAGSSRGILVVFEAPGRSNVHAAGEGKKRAKFWAVPGRAVPGAPNMTKPKL